MDKSRVLTNSVPAVLPGGDLPLHAWQAIGRWMRANTLASAFGLEKGAVELNLDAQGVVRLMDTSAAMATWRLKTFIQPHCEGVFVASKCLTNRGVHTFTGMLGYVHKRDIFHHETDGAGRQTRQQKHESLKRKLEPMLEVFNEAEDYDRAPCRTAEQEGALQELQGQVDADQKRGRHDRYMHEDSNFEGPYAIKNKLSAGM
eukprot:gene32683-17698_t